MIAQRLLQDHSESIVRKCIVEALKGDRYAQRICMERIIPASRDTCIRIKLPRTITARDVDHAAEQVVQSVATGRITPSAGQTLAQILDHRRQAIEAGELQMRVEKLEESAGAQGDDRRTPGEAR